MRAKEWLGPAQRWFASPAGKQLTATDESAFEANTDAQLFRGVFDSFEAAQASAPPTRPIGYDNPQSADLYLKRLRIDDHDYPAMFWIAQSLREGLTRIADLGGAVGIKYFAFSKFVEFPADMTWRVIDVPAVAARGRAFAAQRAASPNLTFSSDVAALNDADVLFASGSLQYLDRTLAEVLATLAKRPKRILVNTTPIHPDRSFFTLNSIGTAFCPYRVQGHSAFLDAIEGHGYRMRDEWKNHGKPLHIPQAAGCDLDHYTGFCFDARE